MIKEEKCEHACECDELENLRNNYEPLKKKYSLPEFTELAEEFDIERAAEKQSSFTLREIRRTINDKISAYLHLFETFTNPSNAPMFIFSMLKNISEDEKQKVKDIYKQLAKIEMTIFKLDTIYSEKSEADFIKTATKEWKIMKKDILVLVEKFDKNFNVNSSTVSRGYFG